MLDEVILVDIYPAREQPIPGVTNKLIYDHLRPGIEEHVQEEEILDVLSKRYSINHPGAGDIDYVPQICGLLNKNDKENSHTPVSVADNRLIVAVTAFNTKPADQVCKGMELIIRTV